MNSSKDSLRNVPGTFASAVSQEISRNFRFETGQQVFSQGLLRKYNNRNFSTSFSRNSFKRFLKTCNSRRIMLTEIYRFFLKLLSDIQIFFTETFHKLWLHFCQRFLRALLHLFEDFSGIYSEIALEIIKKFFRKFLHGFLQQYPEVFFFQNLLQENFKNCFQKYSKLLAEVFRGFLGTILQRSLRNSLRDCCKDISVIIVQFLEKILKNSERNIFTNSAGISKGISRATSDVTAGATSDKKNKTLQEFRRSQ